MGKELIMGNLLHLTEDDCEDLYNTVNLVQFYAAQGYMPGSFDHTTLPQVARNIAFDFQQHYSGMLTEEINMEYGEALQKFVKDHLKTEYSFTFK